MTARRRTGKAARRGLYMISVAAELTGLHPQTLRIYERKRLISPQRSAGNTRLYSDEDITRLRQIIRLTQEEGVNLAGVVRIMQLQDELAGARKRLDEAEKRVAAAMERARQPSRRTEIVHVRRGRLAQRPRDGER